MLGKITRIYCLYLNEISLDKYKGSEEVYEGLLRGIITLLVCLFVVTSAI